MTWMASIISVPGAVGNDLEDLLHEYIVSSMLFLPLSQHAPDVFHIGTCQSWGIPTVLPDVFGLSADSPAQV
jgi:hypothetical protein